MNSVAVSKEFYSSWISHTPSHLKHHGACCETAKQWLIAMGRSFELRNSYVQERQGPRWLSLRFKWGPNPWPISWCEAVRLETIDCGVFAAFAREIFRSKGIAAFPGQVVQKFDQTATGHWRKLWVKEKDTFPWIDDQVVYHEVVIVHDRPGSVRVYDPTEGQWLEADQSGPGQVVAIRSEMPMALPWGRFYLATDQWRHLS